MKLNIVAIRIWLITFGLILFSFIATIFFYGYFYSEQVKENYLNDFEELIVNVESLADQDPHFLLNRVEELNELHSKVNFSLLLNGEYTENRDLWIFPFSDEVYESIEDKPGILISLEAEEDIRTRSDTSLVQEDTIPYVFHVKHLDLDGESAILYSYADMSSLTSIDNTMAVILITLIAVYSFLAFAYYVYLRRNISEPINAMTNIAFDYARDDFSRQLPVSGRDDLSELAMAMNKMGHSLETNRKTIQQEKELLSHIMRNIDTGVLYYDPDKTLLLSNPAGDLFLTQYYVERENFSGQEEFEDVEERLNKVIREKNSTQFNIEMEEFYYLVTILPLLEKDSSEIRGVLMSTQDLTSEHRLDKMRVDFINNISHELRTPLVMVQGYSEAILDDVAETIDEKKEMASIIRDESQRMNRMVNEMLDLSRMEAGFIELQKEVVDLSVYFRKLVSRFGKMAAEKGVKLEIFIPEEKVELSMDRDKMDQVFVNLINNAIRHTGMTDKEEKKVVIRVFEDQLLDDIIMEVNDNGTGIPKEDLPYIFDRFFKADKSRKNHSHNASGTGIGLSLVQNIIETHKGYIEVESEPGQGASFIIHLPNDLDETSLEE